MSNSDALDSNATLPALDLETFAKEYVWLFPLMEEKNYLRQKLLVCGCNIVLLSYCHQVDVANMNVRGPVLLIF